MWFLNRQLFINFHYRYATAAAVFNSAVNEYLKEIVRAIGVEELDFMQQDLPGLFFCE